MQNYQSLHWAINTKTKKWKQAKKVGYLCLVSPATVSEENPSPPAVLQVVDSLDVSAHGTRVGLIQYSSRVRTEFPLNMYHTADEIKAAVMKVK